MGYAVRTVHISWDGKIKTRPCKGVHWRKAVNKWRVVLTINNKRMELGLFIDEVEAVKAYDMAALKYHKEFAKLHFSISCQATFKVPANIRVSVARLTGKNF